MAKYKGSYREEADDMSYSEELQQTEGQGEEEGGQEPTQADGFQKRYGDLRRHMQQKDASHQDELGKLKEQLDQATKKQIKFPKTEDEIKAWAKKYPDVAQIVETIAGMKANEALEAGRSELSDIRRDTTKQREQRAYEELLTLHPDFAAIREDETFHEWAEVQPQYIRDALYKNASDAVAAARAIDLYKADTGAGKKRKNAAADNRDAAQSVSTRGGSAPEGNRRAKFSESMVKKMSDSEYDKNEAAILEAMQQGKFDYDLTGAAR